MIPDPEAVLYAYLSPVAAGLGAEVVGKTPDDTDVPWVRLTLLNAPSDGEADHLVEAYFQLECYAGAELDDAQEEASLLARTIRDALRTIATADHDDVTVNGSRIDGYARVPDTTLEPARERVIVTTTVWMHG